MTDRKTKIDGSQIKDGTVQPSELNTINSAIDSYALCYDNASGNFKWSILSGLTVDGFTILNNSGIISVANRIEENIALLAFYRTVDNTKIKYNLSDGFIDGFVDQSGVDTVNSINQSYNSGSTYYSPISGGIQTRVPTSDLSVQFSRSTGANNYANVDDGTSFANADDNTTYNYTPSDNSRYIDVLGYSAFTIPAGATITSVKVYTRPIETSQSGYGGGQSLIKVNGTNYYSSTNAFSWNAGNYWNFTNSWTVNPATGLAWTIADINGTGSYPLQGFGYTKESVGYSTAVRYTQTWIEVEYTSPGNMTLFSASTTAIAEPNTVRIVILEEDVDAPTINTDILAYVSIDGGTNYNQVTLANEGLWSSNSNILSGTVDVSARTGTSIKWKIVSANNKNFRVHGVSLLWS